MIDPKITKLNFKATIPTKEDYSNVIPEIEIELGDHSWEETRDYALKKIQGIWDLVGKSPLIINTPVLPTQPTVALETLISMDGANAYMDRIKHTYQNVDGLRYLSGSTFSHKFIADFPKDRISKAMAAKAKIDQSDILKMWETNAEASTSLGTAIHAALELYGKYKPTSIATKGTPESVSHKNPLLKAVQKLFFEDRLKETALYEAFVLDDEEMLCGFIDRLLIIDPVSKIARVQDYKTNPDINKPKTILPPFTDTIHNTELGAYWLQLSFYAYILARRGWIIEGLDIFNIVARAQEDGSLKLEMETFSHDVIDITIGLQALKGK